LTIRGIRFVTIGEPQVIDGSVQAWLPSQRNTDPQQDSALAILVAVSGKSHSWKLHSENDRWHLQFDFNHAAFQKLLTHRLGRTVLLTNRMDWSAEQVVNGYSGQQQVEQVFRGLKDGDWLGWGPMYHWTDSKIRIHAFYCMLGISLLKYIHKQSQSAWPGLTLEQMLEELRQIQQFVLLYPPQGEKGPHRAAVVRSKQTLPQLQLAKILGLDDLATQKS
jgi:hypothetical protein